MNLRKALWIPAALGAVLAAAWTEAKIEEATPPRLTATYRGSSVEVRYESGDGTERFIVLFASTNGSLGDLRALTGASVVAQKRTAADTFLFLPSVNGPHYFAVATYLSAEANQQNYRLILLEKPVLVTHFSAAEKKMVSDSTTNAPGLSHTNQASPTVVQSNPTEDHSGVKREGLTGEDPSRFLTAEAVKSLLSPMQNMVVLMSNYLEDRKKPSEAALAIQRDEYFKSEVDLTAESDLSQLVKELRDSQGNMTLLRQQDRNADEIQIHGALIQAWALNARTQKWLRAIADHGWKLTWWNRLTEENALLYREANALWASLLNRYRVDPHP